MKIDQKELLKLGEKSGSKRTGEIIFEFFKKNPCKPYSCPQVCIETGLTSGGASYGEIRRLVKKGKLNTIDCPCGKTRMFYYGKKPKF